MSIHNQLENYLTNHFNHDSFRTGQKEIIEDLLNGDDVFGILPTGTGKSLCYQLPAKLMPGSTIVVSPLISLMIDQVSQLRANQFKEVVALTSFQSYEERRQAYQRLSSYKLIYVSPELLQQPDILKRFQQMDIRLFVIDEAHCISQWGHEFRPDYLRLDHVIESLHNPPVLALSATATADVQTDILTSLNRPKMIKRIYPMDRENIAFNVCEVKNDQEKLTEIVNILSDHHVPTLIYFSSRKATERISQTLSNMLPEKKIAFYHGGMDRHDRISIQQQFMSDQVDVICCTNAFGMGIDKDNIRLVIHYHFPAQLESYIQEVGRAGRDGTPCLSVVLYAKHDEHFPRRMIHNELPTPEDISLIFKKLYEIVQKQINMPVTEQEISDTFQINEIQWRFIYFQLESNGIIKGNQIFYDEQHWKKVSVMMNKHMKERFFLKQRKLIEMIDWMNEQGCLRKHLYKGFQATYDKPTGQCCSNCGISMSEWKPLPHQSLKINTNISWESKLKALLFIGENHEAE